MSLHAEDTPVPVSHFRNAGSDPSNPRVPPWLLPPLGAAPARRTFSLPGSVPRASSSGRDPSSQMLVKSAAQVSFLLATPFSFLVKTSGIVPGSNRAGRWGKVSGNSTGHSKAEMRPSLDPPLLPPPCSPCAGQSPSQQTSQRPSGLHNRASRVRTSRDRI